MKRRKKASSSKKSSLGSYGVLLVVGLFLALFLLISNLIKQNQEGQTIGANTAQANYAAMPYSVGYVGCSNTHDTVEGYHSAQGSTHMFWPFASKSAYPIEGKTIEKWAYPNQFKDRSGNSIWWYFDRMKSRYNAGKDPAVVWVQLCENLNSADSTYHQSTYDEVKAVLANLKLHSPTSAVYISPLQSYNPVDLCSSMGPGGIEQSRDTIPWANQAVSEGLALAGPGTGSVPNLGPLTAATTWTDGCHPSGPAHNGLMPGSGELSLGTQLMGFFDPLFTTQPRQNPIPANQDLGIAPATSDSSL